MNRALLKLTGIDLGYGDEGQIVTASLDFYPDKQTFDTVKRLNPDKKIHFRKYGVSLLKTEIKNFEFISNKNDMNYREE